MHPKDIPAATTMATKVSSFQKKARGKVIQIPGTKISLHNNQLLVSTGIPSLDAVLGGGLAVGTVLLIEEDTFNNYSKLLLKYYLSEGVVCGHQLLLGSADIPPSQILQELPAPLIDDPGTQTASGNESDEHMKIAWRYQHMPQVQSNPSNSSSTRFGHYYDLTKSMDTKTLEQTKTALFDVSEDISADQITTNTHMNPCYAKLLQGIQNTIDSEQFSTAAPKADKTILRIGISSLASPQWNEEGGNDKSDPSLCRFLYALRSILRISFSTCVITMPTHLFQDVAFTKHIEHLTDTVVRLEAFAGSDKEQNPVYKEYHGLFHIIKLPRLNSLTCHMPDTTDLAFKLRRKKFMIEKLHLPPELSETASRSQEDPLKPVNTSCGSGHNKSKLDF